jgi:hypothetical protein
MFTQNDWLLSTLLEFYQNREHLNTLKQIVNREYTVQIPSIHQQQTNSKKISIRMVYWFVTNYAKQYFTAYDIPEEERRFFVWTSYKSTEDSYSKQMFDPYCRQQRVLIPYDNETRIETTVGQLHFFKWAIINRVLEYIIQNYEAIEKDMSVRLNTSRKRHSNDPNTDHYGNNKTSTTRKKREELSTNACRTMMKELCKTPVKIKLT